MDNVEFYDVANFQNSKFYSATDFINVKFNDYAAFNFVNFTGETLFYLVRFVDNVGFYSTIFGDNTKFIDLRIGGTLYLGNSKFKGNVQFFNVEFNNIDINWTILEDTLVSDGPFYIKLIKNFRNNEQFDDADKAYYQYRVQSRKDENGLSWVLSVIMDQTCGYGVRPFNAVFSSGLTILVFTIIYCRKNGISRLKENDGDEDQSVSPWDALYFSMVTFTTVGYGDWYPKDRYRKFVMIEGLLGWLILALFIVTLANVMIRP